MITINLLEEIQLKVNSKKFKEKLKKELNLENMDVLTEIEVKNLANGEYNGNYLLQLEDRKLVLRLNFGSQIGLGDEQIAYEAFVMERLRESGIIPELVFSDSSFEILDRPYLVMKYIRGRHLNYDIEKDLIMAARSLASLHKYSKEALKKMDKSEVERIIRPKAPMEAIIEECTQMYAKYRESNFFDLDFDERVQKIFSSARKVALNEGLNIEPCIINTELNSTNFLVFEDECRIVDWEKPVIGELEQDLGHFLAPTTTFWKTDTILVNSQIERFLENYIDEMYCDIEEEEKVAVFNTLKYKTSQYIVLNCLRGVTWCSMAWVEYNNNLKELYNEDTYEKLKKYLDLAFVDMIVRDFL